MTTPRVAVFRREHFNAAHRLNNPTWSDEKNTRVYGKCNNPNYHGHNYDLIVQVTGPIDAETGYVIDMKYLGDLIKEHVTDRFDHKNLNLDTDEFRDLNPSAENIAIVIHDILRTQLDTTLSLKSDFMKPNGTSLNTLPTNNNPLNGTHLHDELIDDRGDAHASSASLETPLRADAFDLDDTLKIELITEHFREIMQIMGLDLTDDSLKGTPRRVAKMYINETFSGLNPANKPTPTLFENKYQYNQMLVEKDITVQSYCEHHFVPIIGKAHVAYIANGNVIGLSKLNRIVQYFSKRPQVQERLTMQIADELRKALGTEDVAVIIDAKHLCVSTRGVHDTASTTITTAYSGKFAEEATRQELLRYIGMSNATI